MIEQYKKEHNVPSIEIAAALALLLQENSSYTFKTKFNAPGGLGKDRFDKNEKAANFLAKKYPKIVTKKRRKNGTAEIILNKTIKKR